MSSTTPLSIYNARVNNGSDWLPPGEVVVRIGLRTMCTAVSGEKFALKENAGYSA
jgi:hypothetical protein